MKRINLLFIITALVALAGCGQTPAPATTPLAPSAAPGATQLPTATSAPPTVVPTTVPTSAPPTTVPTSAPTEAATPAPATIVPTEAATPSAEQPAYLDNRSDPVAVLQSLYNAVNRREYARAYGYWEAGAQVPAYDVFQNGYADTQQVELVTGPVTGDAGAGQRYYAVPVTVRATQTNGTTQLFAGCYTLHQSNPANFGAPPFRPLAITAATIQQVAPGADPTTLMAAACQNQGQPIDTSGQQNAYLDDRSTPETVIQSLYNAINQKQYVRAYSYWQNNAPPFEQFQQGYAATQSVVLTLGTSSVGAAAGNLYYTLPVTVQATTSDGHTQVFTGCYRLHLAQPQLQSPPFQPLGIDAAHLEQVANGDSLPAPDPASCAAIS